MYNDHFFEDPKYIHFVGMVSPPRPGVQMCFIELEHTYYKPGTKKNDDFMIMMIKWQNMMWAIVSIPAEERYLMEEVANRCGLKIINSVPAILSKNGIEYFPISNERVFYFENKRGHPIYHNDPEINRILEEAEAREIEKIMDKFESER